MNTNETPLDIVLEYYGKLHDALHASPAPEHHKQAISRAFYSKGKEKHMSLLKNAPSPSKDPMAYAAWAGIQPNRYKAASCTGSLMLYLDHEAQQFCLDLRKVRWPMSLDVDSKALSELGVM
jgi:hypothetical protein